MYKYVLNFVVKFVKYFEYYVIMLRGVFCGLAVVNLCKLKEERIAI